jgi:hypothetical protein
MISHRLGAVLAAIVLSLPAAALAASPAKAPPPSTDIADVGTFFVGGHYVRDGQAMSGQAHVLYMTPAKRKHATPLVFMPGAGQTITNFLSTPDGRPGWAKLFVERAGRSI